MRSFIPSTEQDGMIDCNGQPSVTETNVTIAVTGWHFGELFGECREFVAGHLAPPARIMRAIVHTGQSYCPVLYGRMWSSACDSFFAFMWGKLLRP
jgi:hypothetical protein